MTAASEVRLLFRKSFQKSTLGAKSLPSNKDAPRARLERELLRRKLVEIPKGGVFGLLHATKAGRIAAARFFAMRPLLQRRTDSAILMRGAAKIARSCATESTR